MFSPCHHSQSHSSDKKRIDYLLSSVLIIVVGAYMAALLFIHMLDMYPRLSAFTQSIYELVNAMWWGVALSFLFVGFLGRIPREWVIALLGQSQGLSGIWRATVAGVFLDLCSHGILLVGMQLYQRGASLGQVMAFLIASPWNSFSLTFILWGLIGLKWVIVFIIGSMLIAIISGFIFDQLQQKNYLPENPNRIDLPPEFDLANSIKQQWQGVKLSPTLVLTLLWEGVQGSRMILRWILLGLILTALIRVWLSPENFQMFFGATLTGLGLTILMATIIEVCSEGTVPVAADLVTRAAAPGNSFAFLMTGVATDYTEILSLKETTQSWKIAFFLPLITVPQVILLAFLLNRFT